MFLIFLFRLRLQAGTWDISKMITNKNNILNNKQRNNKNSQNKNLKFILNKINKLNYTNLK